MDQTITIIPLKVPAYLIKTALGFILIDTSDASDCAALEKALAQAQVAPANLELVILTHGDFDHTGNAAFLQQKYGPRIAMHAADAGMVERADMGWNRKAHSDRTTLFGSAIMTIAPLFASRAPFSRLTPDILLADGQSLAEYGFAAQVLSLPGHSKGSIGILAEDGSLFCGDLLMNMFKPDLHFMINDRTDSDVSLAKLKNLYVKTVYPGHGKPFAMEAFLKDHPNL
jgi:hydroxyacylglutathione hydrolase